MAKLSKWADGPWPLLQTPSATKDVVCIRTRDNSISYTGRLLNHGPTSPLPKQIKPALTPPLQPQTDHPAHHIANEMAFAHNAMLRGLNAIYLQALNVPSSTPTASDFLFFIAAWSGWILHHHDLEEEKMFPGFESVEGVGEGALRANSEQHDAFEGGLKTLNEYATATKAGEYDGKNVCGMIEGFADALREHLADEIGTLWALDRVSLRHATGLSKVYSECESYAMSSQSKFVVPPMVMGLCDRTYEGGNDWPKMPAIADYVINYVFAWGNQGAWRFLPCDHYRRPRELAFLSKE